MSDAKTAGPATTGHRWLSLAAICTAAGLVWLAFADLGVAIPTMAGELHADLSGLQWANNATLALIPAEFSGPAELTAFGVWQAVAWGGQAIGPAIGGILTSGLGWQWLFWINVPLGVATYFLLRASTPESLDPEASRRIDWPGVATIGLAIFALLFALTDGPSAGWDDPLVIGLLIAFVLLVLAWIWRERTAREPLVDLGLFKLRAYDGALTANLMMNLAFGGLSYLLVLWLQNVTTAVAAGFSDGIADALLVTGGIVLVALIVVRFVWPGRSERGATPVVKN